MSAGQRSGLRGSARPLLLALLVVGSAGCERTPQPPPALLPGFAAELPGLGHIIVEQSGERFELRREGEQWSIAAAAWRADQRLLHPLLLELAAARCDEPRTADAARFARIGVAWPPVAASAEGATVARPIGRLTLVVDGHESQVIIGHPHPRGGTFVRVEGAPHSCLTAARLRLPARAADWFDPRLWATAPGAPDVVTIEDAGAAPLVLRRHGERYLAAGQTVAFSPLADGLVAALLAPRQQGMRPLPADAPPAAVRVLRFDAPPGASHALALRRDGVQTWARVVAAPTGQGAGFAGREFLLAADVADPLWASRESLGAAPAH